MHPYTFLLFRLALGSLWIAAGSGKLAQGEARREAVAGFGLLPERWTHVVGAALPWVELALGLLLLAGLGTRAAAAASAGLLLLFSAAILFNLARGRRIPCNCFGQMGHAPISWWSVPRNAILLAMAIPLAVFSCAYLSMDGWTAGSALRPTDPPVLGFVPVLLITMACLLTAALAASTWAVARTLATATGGPALRMVERRLLLRLPGLRSASRVTDEAAALPLRARPGAGPPSAGSAGGNGR